MFFVTKLLAFLPFGNFLRGPLGKLAIYAGIILAAYLGFQYWLHQRDEAIKDALLLEWNTQQAELTRKQNEEFDRRLAEALKEQEQNIADLEAERKRLAEESIDLIQQLRRNNLQGSGEASSEVLRGAIELLEQRRRNQ